jgi:hypothetical protein
MSEFTSWEEMTVLEQLACTFSDMYKDAHGFRPRGIDTSRFTEEDFRKEFEYLQRVILENDAREREAQAAAARDFEARVGELIAIGAGNRETALRWIMEADGNGYNDWEYVAFVNDLPYGYFRKEAV